MTKATPCGSCEATALTSTSLGRERGRTLKLLGANRRPQQILGSFEERRRAEIDRNQPGQSAPDWLDELHYPTTERVLWCALPEPVDISAERENGGTFRRVRIEPAQDAFDLHAPQEDAAITSDKCIHSLAFRLFRTFLDSVDRTVRTAGINGKLCEVSFKIHGIVTPFSVGNHAAVDGEQCPELAAVKGNWRGRPCSLTVHRDDAGLPPHLAVAPPGG